MRNFIPAKETHMESLKQRIKRVTEEHVSIEPYNPGWPLMFREEKEHLLSCLPNELINRIAHFGSTAVPNLAAKPIIDILVEVASLQETRQKIVPVLTSQGYDYFWRPTFGDDIPPFYAWFIKRNARGKRTHHIHMIEKNASFAEHWDRLFFRDYLIEFPEMAREYENLKLHLADKFQGNRIAYSKSKAEFIQRMTHVAKKYYAQAQQGAPPDGHAAPCRVSSRQCLAPPRRDYVTKKGNYAGGKTETQ